MNDETKNPYRPLVYAVGIHCVIMYVLGYLMVDSMSHVYFVSTRPLYMTLVMVAPMVLIMVYFMRDMLPNKKRNVQIMIGSLVLFVVAFAGARTQFGVGNTMFLKSMIPHHSGAITTCQESNLTDPEIQALCRDIISAQKKEIAQMEEILERL